MATHLIPSSRNAYGDYINSPPESIEFEFQNSSPNEAKPTPSPADELFYKGKLLPLHLPPRLQMVQTLLQNHTTTNHTNFQKPFQSYEKFVTPFNSCTTTNTSTPSESCRPSCEINPDECFFEWSPELSGFVSDNNTKKSSWSEKLKMIKQSILAEKFKASRAHLITLFTKSSCSKGKESLNKYINVATKKSPSGKIAKGAYPITLAAEMAEDSVNSNRKSFSRAIKRHYSATKSSSSSSSSGASSLSSSFSINSNGLYDLQFLKRSNSANSELEKGAIEDAIAHCKKSQQMFG